MGHIESFTCRSRKVQDLEDYPSLNVARIKEQHLFALSDENDLVQCHLIQFAPYQRRDFGLSLS